MARASASPRWLAWTIITLVTLFALYVRWYYVVSADVMQPAYLLQARGDAADYYRYAWNLVHHGVFSIQLPGPTAPIPDSFRDPGYPLLMAIWLRALDDWQSFYAAMLLSQAMLGAATVGLLLVAARRWFGWKGLLSTGLVMALWPHSVAAASFLLSEVLFAFLVALALALWVEASARKNPWLAASAGVAFSLAALTNAILIPFAPMVALLIAVRSPSARPLAMALLVASLTLPLAWVARNANLQGGVSAGDRAVMNLVQGSWPSYHQDFRLANNGDAHAQAEMEAMDTEIAAFKSGKLHGLANLWERIGDAPGHYLAWYLSKPALLWQWDIRIGQGDVYTYGTQHSPFVESAPMRAAWAVCRAANPLIAIAAFAICLWILLTFRKGQDDDLACLALLAIYVTSVYGALQSEPRYAVPFRGEEVLLAFLAVKSGYMCALRLISTRQHSQVPRLV